MSSIQTLNNWETGSSIRWKVNSNFTALNTDKAETSALATKQDTLVSGTNIKTVNGNSLLGSGDLTISGGGWVTYHWALTGLSDDDHTQYTKSDGTRAFSGKVSYSTHPTFSIDTELVDKKYVDDSITAGGGYTDEQAQDAVGTILVDSARIDFTYNDATPSITADIIDDSVTFAKIQNVNTNRILGRSTAGSGDIEELNVTAIPALIGLWTSDSPQFSGVNIWHESDTTITRVSSWVIAVEWKTIPFSTLPSTATDGATVTFDLSINNKHQVTIASNRTLALSNTTNIPAFSINIKQDATGSRTVTWFSWITWAGGTAPTLTTTANKTDSFWFQQISSGVYLGFVIAQNI